MSRTHDLRGVSSALYTELTQQISEHRFLAKNLNAVDVPKWKVMDLNHRPSSAPQGCV